MGKSYQCLSCNSKYPSEEGLIKGKGGCSSCGRSALKCPKCGMSIKVVSVPNMPPQPGAFKPIDGYRGSNGISERSIKVRKA